MLVDISAADCFDDIINTPVTPPSAEALYQLAETYSIAKVNVTSPNEVLKLSANVRFLCKQTRVSFAVKQVNLEDISGDFEKENRSHRHFPDLQHSDFD